MNNVWASIFVVLALLVIGAEPAPARADTTADCGRFHLKYDKKPGRMKCANGKRKKRNRMFR
jgi:hypothetical protein